MCGRLGHVTSICHPSESPCIPYCLICPWWFSSQVSQVNCLINAWLHLKFPSVFSLSTCSRGSFMVVFLIQVTNLSWWQEDSKKGCKEVHHWFPFLSIWFAFAFPLSFSINRFSLLLCSLFPYWFFMLQSLSSIETGQSWFVSVFYHSILLPCLVVSLVVSWWSVLKNAYEWVLLHLFHLVLAVEGCLVSTSTWSSCVLITHQNV